MSHEFFPRFSLLDADAGGKCWKIVKVLNNCGNCN